MGLRPLALVVALGILLAPLAAEAQPPKVPRIGFLETSSPSARQHLWEAFRQRLRELGYVEGQNIAFEPRYAHGKTEQLPDLAAELVGLKVDVIVTAGTQAALAAILSYFPRGPLRDESPLVNHDQSSLEVVPQVAYLECACPRRGELDDRDLAGRLKRDVCDERPDADLVQMLALERLHEQPDGDSLLDSDSTERSLRMAARQAPDRRRLVEPERRGRGATWSTVRSRIDLPRNR
jgi:hypothetical protein